MSVTDEKTTQMFTLSRMHGGELFDRIADRHYILTETAIAMIMGQVCEALRYVHSNSIIHLDVKV